MTQQIYQCPYCNSQMRVGNPAPPQVRCPSCAQVVSIVTSAKPHVPTRPQQDFSTYSNSPLPSTYQKPVKRENNKSFLLPAVIGGAVVASLIIVGFLGFFLISRPDRDIAEATPVSAQSEPTTGNATAEPHSSGIESQKAPARKAPQPRKATETREQVLKDAVALFDQIEKEGDSIAESDQSAETAKNLRGYIPQMEAMLIRACQIAPVEVNLEKAQTALSLNIEPRRNRKNTPPEKFFWSIDTRNPQDKPVTLAVNQLTSFRAAIFGQLGQGIADLPSPLDVESPESEWTDEDRRVLEIVRTTGQLSRDFAFCLAPVDVKNPSENDLSLLHDVIDRYTERARQIQRIPGNSGFFAEVPRGSPYQLQNLAAYAALMKLKSQLLGGSTRPDKNYAHPEIEWLASEFARTRESIDDLSFYSGKRTKIASNTSYERYLAKVEADAQAKAAAEQAARKAEKQRVADAERERKAKEERKRLAEQQRKEDEEQRQLANQLRKQFGERPDSPFRPGGRGGMRRPGFAGKGFAPGSGEAPRGPRFGPVSPSRGIPPGEDRDTTNDVTIRVKDARNLDTKSIANGTPKWLRAHGVSVHESNGKLKIVVQNFDEPLSKLKDAFPNLNFESVDDANRLIIATEK